MKQLKEIDSIDDLEKGDVLLFKGEEGDWISEGIMYFTKSDVSHSAIYNGNGEFTHEYPPVILKENLQEYLKSNSAYVRRFNNNNLSLDPVLSASEKHLKNKDPYSYSSLVFLGLILIYKKMTPSSRTQDKLIELFKMITVVIINEIDKGLYKGKNPMNCSQFVYQCFKEAGKQYDLGLKNGVLSTERSNLINHVFEEVSKNQDTYIDACKPKDNPDTEAVNQIIKELIQIHKMELTIEKSRIKNELIVAVIRFCEALCKSLGIKDIFSIIDLMCKNQSLFVTPEDLKDNCTNLIPEGLISKNTKAAQYT